MLQTFIMTGLAMLYTAVLIPGKNIYPANLKFSTAPVETQIKSNTGNS
jgi:hypothetical protein